MKYIKEYLKDVIKVKPLGELTTKDDELNGISGEMVYIDGKCSDIFIAHIDYVDWFEKQSNKSINIDIESMVSSYKQRLKNQAGIRMENNPLVNMCLSAFRRGVENTLEELNLRTLEKQGEQKPVDSYCQENCKGFQETGKCFADGDCKAKREAESNDKNEPKFHEGDWVIYNNDICQIVKREEGCNILVTQFGVEKEPVNERNLSTAKLWDISDAKNGDILFHSDSASNGIFIFKEIIDKGFAKEVICYCDYDSEDHFCLGEHHTCCWTNSKILHPATKEQRDLLFAKMKEAGCMFDFKNKELKKIETEIEIPFGAKDSELQEATYFIPKGFHAEIDDDDKVVIKKGEKPTAWSKKDEKMFEYALNMIEWYSGKNEDKSRFVSDWLKSLKQRIGG